MAVYPTITNTVNISLDSSNYSSAIYKKMIMLKFDKSGYTITNLSFKYYDSSSSSYVEFYNVSSFATSTDFVSVSTSALIPVPEDSNSVPIRITYNSVVNSKTYSVTKDGTATLDSEDRLPTLTVSVEHFVIAQTKTSLTDTLGSGYNVTTYGQVDISLKGTASFSGSIKQYTLALKSPETEIQNTITGEDISSTMAYFKINKDVAGDYTLSVTATDYRGNVSEPYTTTFTVLSYSIPTTSILAARENGYEKETAVTIKNPTISPLTIDGVDKNELVSVIYKYKASSDSTAWEDIEGESVSISDNLAGVTTIYQEFDDTTEYIVRAYVTDKITTIYAENILAQGIPVMVEATDGHVTVGMVPEFESDALFQVASDIMATDADNNRRLILEELDTLILQGESAQNDINTLNSNYSSLIPADVTFTYNTTNFSACSYRCEYIPLYNMVFFSARFTRSFTASGTGIVEYSMGTVEEGYTPSITQPLTAFASIGKTDSDLMGGFIRNTGEIAIKILGDSNPSYFYIQGFWYLTR